jgi:hypothetical protein
MVGELTPLGAFLLGLSISGGSGLLLFGALHLIVRILDREEQDKEDE